MGKRMLSFRALPMLPIILGAVALFLGVPTGNAASTMQMDTSGAGGAMPGMQHPSIGGTKFSFGEPAKGAKVDRVVNVTMLDVSFEPKKLDVRIGETIRFVVTNKSALDHDFTIGDVKAQTAHRKEMADALEKNADMHHGDDPNAISVKAGESGELSWKFTRAGSFEFDCNVPGHYEAGMKGAIAVHRKGSSPAAADQPPAPGG